MAGICAIQTWKAGCFAGRIPSELASNGTWEHYVEMLRTRWSFLDPFETTLLVIHRGLR